MPPAIKLQAATLEAAIRRHLSHSEWRKITSTPRTRELLVPIHGTRKFPGRPCVADLEANGPLLRAVVESFPDRIPGIDVIALAVRMLDDFHSGNVLQFSGQGFVANGLIEASVDIAAVVKHLTQRLRRLFRRSAKSRFFLWQCCFLVCRFRPGVFRQRKDRGRGALNKSSSVFLRDST